MRRLFIGSFGSDPEVDMNLLCDTIIEWNAIDMLTGTTEILHVYINSTGGCIHKTQALINLLYTYEGLVYTYNIGIAYSAALSVFACGDTRFAYKTSGFMCHPANFESLEGDIKLLTSIVSQAELAQSYAYEMMRSNTNNIKCVDDILKYGCSTDYYFSAIDPVAKGVVDRVLDNRTSIVTEPIVRNLTINDSNQNSLYKDRLARLRLSYEPQKLISTYDDLAIVDSYDIANLVADYGFTKNGFYYRKTIAEWGEGRPVINMMVYDDYEIRFQLKTTDPKTDKACTHQNFMSTSMACIILEMYTNGIIKSGS